VREADETIKQTLDGMKQEIESGTQTALESVRETNVTLKKTNVTLKRTAIGMKQELESGTQAALQKVQAGVREGVRGVGDTVETMKQTVDGMQQEAGKALQGMGDTFQQILTRKSPEDEEQDDTQKPDR